VEMERYRVVGSKEARLKWKAPKEGYGCRSKK